MVALYQLQNAFTFKFYNPLPLARNYRVEVKNNTGSMFSFELPGINSDGGVFHLVDVALIKWASVDSGAGTIAHAGHALRYLGGQANQGILIGPKDPLQRFFWRDDIQFSYPAIAGPLIAPLKSFIKEQVDYLESRGVHVVVVPPPTQASINTKYFEPLPRMDPWTERKSGERVDARRVYADLVSASPRHIVDIHSIFAKELEENPAIELFGPFNSHWSSLGIALAARGAIAKLREQGWKISLPRLEPAGYSVPHYQHDFLLNLLLPQYFLSRLSAFQWAEPLYRLTETRHENQYFPLVSRVVLAGTSYSTRFQNTEQSLGGMLAKTLNASLVDFSFDGSWAGGSLKKMVKEGFRFSPGDLFVWEVPLKASINLKHNPQHLHAVRTDGNIL